MTDDYKNTLFLSQWRFDHLNVVQDKAINHSNSNTRLQTVLDGSEIYI